MDADDNVCEWLIEMHVAKPMMGSGEKMMKHVWREGSNYTTE